MLEGLTSLTRVSAAHAGPVYKYDLSIPVAEMYALVEETRQRMAHLPVEVVGYGHLGDGNLHLNVSCERYDDEILRHIEPFVYEWTAARRGSISAEHGLGQMKAECIRYFQHPSLRQTLTMPVTRLLECHVRGSEYCCDPVSDEGRGQRVICI